MGAIFGEFMLKTMMSMLAEHCSVLRRELVVLKDDVLLRDFFRKWETFTVQVR